MALEVQGSLSESSEIFTRLCKMLCRSHDDQRAGSFLKQLISMAFQIGNAACDLGSVSPQRFVRRSLLHIFKPLYHSSLIFLLSTVIVAGMSSLLVVFSCYWDSGWYGVLLPLQTTGVCLPPTWWYTWHLIDDGDPWYLIEEKTSYRIKYVAIVWQTLRLLMPCF